MTEYLASSSDLFNPDSRPFGLYRWSFDDNAVREVWPEHISNPACAGTSPSLFSLRLVYEGVSDQEVLLRVAQLLDAPVQSFQLVTPIDFFASVERHCVCSDVGKVTAALARLWKSGGDVPQSILSKEGTIHVFAPQALPVHALSGMDLPDLEYTVVIRGCDGSMQSIMRGIENLASVGFVNYSSLARSGFQLHRSYLQGHHLLSHQFTLFLKYFLMSLSEGRPAVNRELNEVAEYLSRPEGCSTADWKHLEARMAEVLRDELKSVPLGSGLYRTHFSQARQFVSQVAAMRSTNDVARIIRECVSREYLADCVQSLADVHFNALASLRMRKHGAKVVVGDIVCIDKSRRMDEVECRADHVPLLTFPIDARRSVVPSSKLHIVATQSEASSYSISDVVLPKFGRTSPGHEAILFPKNSIDGQAFEAIANRL